MGCLRLGEPLDERVAEIVEAAGDTRRPACALPGDLPGVHRLRGDDFVGTLFSVVPGGTVHLMRENVVLWL